LNWTDSGRLWYIERGGKERFSLRILHSIVLDGWSAGSWYAVNMAHYLNLLGHENLFVCRPGCRTRDEAVKAGLQIHDEINLESKNPLHMVGNLSRLGALLLKWKPDVICAHWGEDHSYWGLLKSLYRDPVPLVRVRSLDPKPPNAHPLSRLLHENQTSLIVVSNSYLRRCYLDLFVLREEKVKIVPPGLDVSEYEGIASGSAGYKADHPTVGLLARFSPVKGHRYFFEATRLVAEQIPKVRFLLAGFESELKTPDLVKMAENAGIVGQTEIIDRRDGPSAPIIARFDVGVVSSIYSESVSRSMMEYLAAGVAVVATDVGGVPDLLAEGDFGTLVPPENPQQLAMGIVNLLRDHNGRRCKGEAGREFIRTQRTWEQAAKKFAHELAVVIEQMKSR